jgi:hypothetical protein
MIFLGAIMFKKKQDENTEPFDPSSYEPEPTNHFDDSVDDMSKTFGFGALLFGAFYAIKRAYEGGMFN